ncbi:3-phosphoshikimate 1-carboxyvinyltransferase [Rheinheimera riviphila]|uniref:3-phosphoshikimate 1-carboxyvinyltransferase n=2 Tax=Rheinheimera riviphila TaxID=1834037 RepID=A0A437QSV1_9GAMM|nr:3-phosphoshikimate 1-carboxyvinyltransferase [Rheinheimera riviphila]
MPADIGESFTEQQLSHLRVALGARQWGKHQLDLRGTLRIFHWRYYYVVVAGRNLRDGARSQQQFSKLMLAVIISMLLVVSAGLGVLLLYLVKSAFGIDLFDGFSLGIWSWFKALFA